MRSILAICLLGTVAHLAIGQDTLPVPGIALNRNIGPGDEQRHTLHANAGELISGMFEPHGATAIIEVRDPSNVTLRTFGALEEPLSRTQRIGFVAPVLGEYQIRIVGVQPGSYTLRLAGVAASTRMRGVSVVPKNVYSSDRIEQLTREMDAGRRDAVDRFWHEIAGKGPIVESSKDNDQEVLVTFLWRETYELHNVLLVWSPAWFRADDYYMSRLPGSDVWYKTLRIHTGTRFSYALSPNDTPADRELTTRADPLNPRRYPESLDLSNSWVTSVFELPGAPDESWFRRTPTLRGQLEPKKFKSTILKGERDIWLYTPAGYTPRSGPYPLVILFDGAGYLNTTWNGGINTFDNLMADRRIRSAVVCFVDTSKFRATDLGFGTAFGDAIATELLPMLRSSYAIANRAQDVVVGGYSAGGTAAALIALRHSGLFGNVLSQSGNFRARMPGSPEPNSLTRLYRDTARIPVRFYLDWGLYDNIPTATLPLDEMALDEALTQANRHFRDVLLAKGYDVTYQEIGGAHEAIHFRATMADGLMALLKSPD